MSRSLRIPGLVDLIQADVRSDIRGLADDARLDRSFDPRGPLINRILVQRILAMPGVRGGHLLGFGDGYVEIEEVRRAGGITVGVATAIRGKPSSVVEYPPLLENGCCT